MSTMYVDYEYPQLQMFEHPILSEHEYEYFKMGANEINNRNYVEAIIGGVFFLAGIVLTAVFIFFELPAGILFSVMMLVMAVGFLYNAMTVKGNTEDRFKKGEIMAAEIIIPNVDFLRRRNDGARGDLDRVFYYRMCSKGTLYEKKYIIHLLKRDSSGNLISCYNSISSQMEIEAREYIGKRCLAKLDYRRGVLYEIEIFLDEIYTPIYYY